MQRACYGDPLYRFKRQNTDISGAGISTPQRKTFANKILAKPD
jgi:hypothetical protein